MVYTSRYPSESYHCSSVMNETMGLAAMKTRIASKNSATPPQKRLGICGKRISLPASNGPPRSNGSNGRYRRDM